MQQTKFFIMPSEFRWSFIRSSGPGGQNVNKTNTCAVLEWHFEQSQSLTDAQKDAIRVQLEHTIESIAEEISKSQGNLPIEIQQLINGFVKPKPKFNYKKYILNKRIKCLMKIFIRLQDANTSN